MSSSINQTSSGNEEEDEFPIAAIVCIAVGAYVLIIIAIIVIKQMLSSHGSCKSECCQPVEDGRRPCCCTFCAKAGESCTCCSNCHVNGCLTKICGKPKRTNCIDILLCNCGGCTENCCTGCKCCCSCLQDVKCSTCCVQSSGSFFPSCKNCCTDICCDAPDSGACGCLCLEVKLRSPRHGSSRRSQSAPPVKGNSGKQFSTHFPPEKEIEREISFTRNGSAGDFIRSEAFSEMSVSNLKLRSTSFSPPKKRNSSPSNRNENNSGRVSKNVLLSRTNSSKISHGSMEMNANNSYKSKPGSQRRTSSVHGNEESKVQGSHRTSRQRKSLRVGQQSQRFPQHVLVSLESQDNTVDLSRPSSDENVVKFYSMPVQRSVLKRPLPPLKDKPHSTKLSKTN